MTLDGEAFRGESPENLPPLSDHDWPVYGRDKAGSKYSPIDQVHSGNVDRLRPAWRWDSVDNVVREQDDYLGRTMFEATPLMIRNTLFFTTAFTRVVALDAGTGIPAWIYDPESHLFDTRTPLGIHSRGVTYWRDGDEERIFFGSSDGYLISLDARTGVPIAEFGEKGRIDLTEGLGRPVERRFYSVTSPPVICDGILIVGSWIPDMPIQAHAGPGHVRGFDAQTGELLWTFHTIPQEGELGVDTWEDNAWEVNGHTNVWTAMTADEELGYVYLPVSMPTDNFYGGARLGDNLFANSLVALDARTGKLVWYYQMIHHDVWDYDVPAPPNLIDIVVDGQPVMAVAQVMKNGFCYVFDRITGEPVWPILEHSVAASSLPGERLSPTQPFPTRPPPFDRQTLGPEAVIDFTSQIRADATEWLAGYDHGPLYVPPSERGAVYLPGWSGGANWGGAGFDPETGTLYVPSITLPILVRMGPASLRTWAKNWFGRAEDRIESAYEIKLVQPALMEDGLPVTKPPYGRITAYDMNRGEIRWQAANGYGPVLHPRLKHLDLPRLGSTGRTGVLVTKTLLFAGEGPSTKSYGGEPYFRAYDKDTGELLWEIELDSHVVGSPMTYMVDGSQFVVVAVGGSGQPHELVAFKLDS